MTALIGLGLALVMPCSSEAAQKVARVTGSWNSTATWGGDPVPESNDKVTINNGVTVTVPNNYTGECFGIDFTTGSGVSSIILADATAGLKVKSSVTIQRNGSAANTVNVGAGNLTAASLVLQGTTGGARLSRLLISKGGATISGNITAAGGDSHIAFSDAGRLDVGGSFMSGTAGTFTPSTGTVNCNGTAAQTVGSYTFHNLTISGSGTKTISGATVSGILSMEGTATASAAPTYGSGATLRYNTAVARASGPEWPATFSAAGGVVITNTGPITLNSAKSFAASVPLTICAGAAMNTDATRSWGLTLAGDFVNHGAFVANGSAITLSGTSEQSIAGFATTGAVSMVKTAGTATLMGNVTGGALTINGSGGTLHLGAGLTHTFAGTWTRIAGSLIGGTSSVTFGGNAVNTGGSFTGDSGTVIYNSSSAQTMACAGATYNDLTVSGGTKTASADLIVDGTLTISGCALDLGVQRLSGSFTTSGGGALWVRNTTASPMPPEKTWNFSVMYLGAGSQTIAGGTYQGGSPSLRIENGGMNMAAGDLIVSSGTLRIVAPAGLDMNGHDLVISGNQGGIDKDAGAAFSAGAGMAIYNRAGDQAISTTSGITFNNLALSGSGVKTIPPGTVVTGNLSAVNCVAGLTDGIDVPVNSLALGGIGRIAGTWGSTASTATYRDSNYFGSTRTGILTVRDDTRSTASILYWPTASGITFGQVLADSTLSGGSAAVAGSFAFAVPATAPAAGAFGASVIFSPTEVTGYLQANGIVTVMVGRAESTVTAWPTAAAITYGGTLGSAMLSGGAATPPGTFAFASPLLKPGVGTSSYSVIFTPDESANYNSVTGSAFVTVNRKTLTPSVTLNNRVYDGTTNATTIATRALAEVVGSDDVSLGSSGIVAGFGGRNAGSYAIRVSDLALSGTTADRYLLSSITVTSTAAITRRTLTVTAATDSKMYDGTTVSTGQPAITAGTLAGGDVEPVWTQTFNNKHAGTGKTLAPAGTVVDGNGGNNYSVTLVSRATGAITARPLTVTAAANSKVYDGAIAAATAPAITLGEVQPGDTANFTETYDTKHVGTGKTLTPSGTVSDGNSGNNYTYTFEPADTGEITTRPLTVTAVANSKACDGTMEAATVPAVTSGAVQSGDTADFVQTYATMFAGATNVLVPSGTVSDGNNGDNYSYTFVPAAVGAITVGPVTRLAFITAPVAVGTNVESGPITVQRVDACGNPNAGEAPRLVTLASDSIGTVTFSPATLTIPAGSSSASFTYKDTAPGWPIITASSASPDAATPAAQQQTIIGAPIDLSIAVSGSPDPVPVGEDIAFAIAVSNRSLEASGPYSITNRLPGGLAYVNSTDGGWHGGGLVRWALAALPAGGTRTVSVTARATHQGSATTISEVWPWRAELDPSNNFATNTTSVYCPVAGLAPNNAPASVVATNDSYLAFSVTTTNSDCNPPILSAFGLPAGATFTTTTNGYGVTGLFTWPLPALGTHPVRFRSYNETKATSTVVTLIYVGVANEPEADGIPVSQTNWCTAITNLLVPSSGNATVIWAAVDGVTYDVYSSALPMGGGANWAKVVPGYEAHGVLATAAVEAAVGGGMRFYQVVPEGAARPDRGVWGLVKPVIPSGVTMFSPPVESDLRFNGQLGTQLAAVLPRNSLVYILEPGEGAWTTLRLNDSGIWVLDGGSEMYATPLAPAQGFFVNNPGASVTPAIRGPVGNDGTKQHALSVGFNIIGLSKGRNLNAGSAFESAVPVGSYNDEAADQVVLLEPSGVWRRLIRRPTGTWYDTATHGSTTLTLTPGQAYYYIRRNSPTTLRF